jgi:CBS domain-containing protein
MKSKLEVPLSELFPDQFRVARPMISPETPLMTAGSMLASYEHPILEVTRTGAPQETQRDSVKLFRAVGGAQIVRLLLKSKPSDYHDVLWGPASAASMWLGVLDFEDSLDRLLSVFELTGFGDAMLTAPGRQYALVSLDDLIRLYRERWLKCDVQLKEVASKAHFVDPGASLVEAMGTMQTKRVRRLFVAGGDGRFVSDRTLLGFLFSPRSLAIARQTPDTWMKASVSDLRYGEALRAPSTTAVEEAARMIKTPLDVLWLPDEGSVVSRWDLTMKPWKKERLSVAPSTRRS